MKTPRRSVRRFEDRPVEPARIEGLIEAAVGAPSPSNRQPWRFDVVTSGAKKAQVVDAIRSVVADMRAVIARSHHREDFDRYSDFFFEPLERAPVVIIPQYRVHADLIERLLVSGGAQPGDFVTPGAMQGELACTAAAVMNLMNAAHAEGLGTCWMAGPTVAREGIGAVLGISPPWTMLGALALGWPDETPEPRPRKSIAKVVRWH